MVAGTRSGPKARSERTDGSAAGRIGRALDVVTNAPRGVTAAEAAPLIGLSRTAGLRLLESMVEAGILTKDPDSHRYDLSLRVFQWGSRAASSYQPIAAVRQEMARLADASGHQIIYSVLDDDSVVIVEATELTNGPTTTRPAWSRTHWYGSTTGTLLVALAEPKQQQRLLDGLEARSEASVWPEQDLHQLLDTLARDHFGARQLRPGTTTLATALLDHTGRAVAALGMFVNSNDPADIEKLGDALKVTGAVCSSFLGYNALAHH